MEPVRARRREAAAAPVAAAAQPLSAQSGPAPLPVPPAVGASGPPVPAPVGAGRRGRGRGGRGKRRRRENRNRRRRREAERRRRERRREKRRRRERRRRNRQRIRPQPLPPREELPNPIIININTIVVPENHDDIPITPMQELVVPASGQTANEFQETGDADFDEAARACHAEVCEIIARCSESGEKYEDPDFVRTTDGGDDTANAGLSGSGSGAEWRRLGEMTDEPKIFEDGSDPDDVVQGRLGSCYLLGALAGLSVVPGLVERLFSSACSFEHGVFGVMIFDAETRKWTYVVIDDLVPVDWNGDPIYARSVDEDEHWVSLLEKAYAKYGRRGVTGVYANIAGGRPERAMVDYSGGFGSVLFDGHPSFSFEAIDKLCDTRRHVLAAASDETHNGIVAGHAYTVLEGYELEDGTELLKLRNPWGSGEWEGPYSDGSPEMTDELAAFLGYTEKDDGTFFMEYEDFVATFSDVSVLELPEGFLTEA